MGLRCWGRFSLVDAARNSTKLWFATRRVRPFSYRWLSVHELGASVNYERDLSPAWRRTGYHRVLPIHGDFRIYLRMRLLGEPALQERNTAALVYDSRG